MGKIDEVIKLSNWFWTIQNQHYSKHLTKGNHHANYFFIKDSTISFLSSFERRIRDFLPPDSLLFARAYVWRLNQPPFVACMMPSRPQPFSMHTYIIKDENQNINTTDSPLDIPSVQITQSSTVAIIVKKKTCVPNIKKYFEISKGRKYTTIYSMILRILWKEIT